MCLETHSVLIRSTCRYFWSFNNFYSIRLMFTASPSMANLTELAITPAMPVPGGEAPDFNQATDFPGILIASFTISFSLATLFLVLRLYRMSAITRTFHLDDGE